jgi:hypothetical protein
LAKKIGVFKTNLNTNFRQTFQQFPFFVMIVFLEGFFYFKTKAFLLQNKFEAPKANKDAGR